MLNMAEVVGREFSRWTNEYGSGRNNRASYFVTPVYGAPHTYTSIPYVGNCPYKKM